MYKIVEAIANEQTPETPNEFADLLDIPEHKISLWAAVHILERLPTDKEKEEKALTIIKTESQGDSADAIGYQFWLKNWNENNK